MKRSLLIFDRWWPLPMMAIAPMLAFLNIDAEAMSGIYPQYLCFRAAILAGVNPAGNHCPSPTFPMWGYGWLLVVTQDRMALLLFQNAVGIAAAAYFVWTLQKHGLLHGVTLRVVKLIVVLLIPFYALNSVRWPYSLASSLLLFSIAALLSCLRSPRGGLVIAGLAGLALGGVLNFRSDYIALGPLLGVAVVAAASSRRRLASLRVAVCITAAFLTLVPWMVYSHRATGTALLTSTNSGHVLYIGLGQLPNNPWAITPYDEDPRMHQELDAHFGRHVSSLTYTSDRFLQSRFSHLVGEQPTAWARKVIYDAWHTIVGGFYPGEFIEQAACQPNCPRVYGLSNAQGASNSLGTELRPLYAIDLTATERSRYLIDLLSLAEGKVIAFFGFVVSPVLAVVAWRRRDLPMLVLSLVPTYQVALNAFGYYLHDYSAMVMLITLAVAGMACQASDPSWPRRAVYWARAKTYRGGRR